jgi:hypothetical protein
MITTLTLWKLAVDFGFQISRTGGASKRKGTQSMQISLVGHTTYSVSYLKVSKWRPDSPLNNNSSAGGTQKAQARSFMEKS